jgi:hypothetical protein
MPLATNLVPVRENTLGWLGWRQALVGVEPVPAPVWAERPPDPTEVDARVRRESASLRQEYDTAAHNVAYFAPVVRAAVVACGFALFATGFLVVAYLSSGLELASLVQTDPDAAAEPPEISVALTIASITALFGPWFAAAVIQRRRRLTKPTGRFGVGLGLWFLALVLACFTLGLSFVLMPAVVGLLGLLTRPTVFQLDQGTTGRAPASALRMWRDARQAAATARSALGDVDRRVREEVERLRREHTERGQAHQHALSTHVPYAVAGLPEVRDLVVVGGTPVERGDLLHHLGAAAAAGTGIWVLDLEGRGACERLLAEATVRQRPVGMLTAADEDALVELLDALDSQAAGRSSALVEVLAYALAQDAEGRVVARARQAADTLRRVEQHLRSLPGGMTVARLHAAIDALLTGREQVAEVAARDDFGLAEAATAASDGAAPLPADVVERVRASFSQQDRQHFYPIWTDLRIKLETLLPGPGGGHPVTDPQRRWSARAACNIVVAPSTLGRADRELRTCLLVAHHLQLLKGSGPAPAALVVVNAGQVPPELLTDLSDTANNHGVLLVAMFTELVPAVEQLALGRRHIAVFGGHGAQAAERLAELFGKGWLERVQSYQKTWSLADAESRAETSGRNWSIATQRSRSRGSSSSHSSSSGSGSGSPTTSHSWSTNSSTSTGETKQHGESSSTSVTIGSTETRGGSETTTREYERQVTGSEISALPPFTMLLKHGGDVRYVDVKADLPLPEQLTGAGAPRS